MRHHVFQALYHHSHGNGIVSIVALQGHQVPVEVSYKQEFPAPGSLGYVCHNVLQGGGVMWRKIATSGDTEDPYRRHMEAEDVWALHMQRLLREVPQLLVKNRNVPAVADRRIGVYHEKPFNKYVCIP